jgi:HEAT repeat protein
MKAKRDVEGLIKALGYHKDVAIRSAAHELQEIEQARKLGRIGDARAAAALVAMIGDISRLRCQAAGALGQIGDARAVAPLIAALWGPLEDVRGAAAGALAKIGSPAVAPLVDVLKRPVGLHKVATAAAGALAKIGGPAVAPLIDVLKDRRGDVREAAAAALVKIGSPAVPPLIAALRDRESVSIAATALGQIGDARAIEPLIGALKGGIATAADALGQIGDARAVEPLIAALEDICALCGGNRAGEAGRCPRCEAAHCRPRGQVLVHASGCCQIAESAVPIRSDGCGSHIPHPGSTRRDICPARR